MYQMLNLVVQIVVKYINLEADYLDIKKNVKKQIQQLLKMRKSYI